MIDTAEKIFSFAEFEVDAAKRRLARNGSPVALNPKAFELLLVLIENRGQIVRKEELLETVWANQFVEENNLTVHISALRKIFGEKKGEHQFIVTVPGKGYKFVADVLTPNDEEKEIIIESRTVSRVVIEEENNAARSETETAENNFPKLKEDFSKLQKNRLPLVAISAVAVAALIFLFVGLFGYIFQKTENKSNNLEFKLNKLTTSGEVSCATVTRDGKYAVFAQTETDGESLYLRHISTGSQKQILPAKPVRFVGLAVAPDGDTIYATVFSPAFTDPQIWRVPLLGGSFEEIKGIATGAAISFSPAGDKIAFIESRSAANENDLLISDASGANRQLVLRAAGDARSFSNFNANPVAWSPAGDEIACAVAEETGAGAIKSGILLVNAADGGERFISESRWDYVEHLTWTDAENLAFVAYTSEPWRGQIWTVSRRTGETRQITNDLNSYSWLASGGGNLLTVQKNAVSHISIGDYDEKNNRIEPREILSESGYIDSAVWAPDGAILYTSSASGKSEIWRVEPDGSNPSQLTAGASVSFGFAVSPAGGSIVFCSNESGRYSLKIMNADGKNIRPLTEGAEDFYPNFTADGQTVIFQRGLKDKLVTLWRVSLADKNPLRLTETLATHPAVSSDGTRAAHYFMDAETDNLWRIRLVSAVDGAYLGKLSFPKFVTERQMRWHPSGKYIGQIFYEGENIKLLLLPTGGGGEPQVVSGFGKGGVNWFDWSPDGRRIVFSHITETEDAVLLSK